MWPILFKIGRLNIYTYGFFVLLGILIGYFFSLNEAKKIGITKKNFSDIIFFSLIFSFIGARIFYIFGNFELFLADPIGMIFSRSGFVFYGGLFFGFISAFFYTKKYNVDFLGFLDVVTFGVVLGHAIGRIGCFCYGCCYGKPTNSFIGVVFPHNSIVRPIGAKVIPTQLIESFFLIVIFFILIYLKKRVKFKGWIFSYYCILYGFFRFIIEFFRADVGVRFMFLSASGWLSIIIILIGFYFKKIQKIKKY